MRNLIFFISIFCSYFCSGQVSVVEKYTLDSQVNETSGLLYVNDRIITHNDSGDDAKLYELNPSNGQIERTIVIANATNVDWEDLAKDEDYIYIGDIGNNSGNRTDLKIYKISIADFLNQNSVTAAIISFEYEDQSEFTPLPNANNFDAEALLDYGDDLLIFTKNWQNFQTNVYKVSKTPGAHSASKVSTGNVGGLITGASVAEANDDLFFLCGYDATAIPFLIVISDNRMPGDDIFNGGFTKESLQDNPLGFGSQVEGIVSYAKNKIYITRERVEQSVNGTPVILEPKLYEVTEPYSSLLSTAHSTKPKLFIKNPVDDVLKVWSDTPIKSIQLYSIEGKELMVSNQTDQLEVSRLPSGVYYVLFILEDNSVIREKLLKH